MTSSTDSQSDEPRRATKEDASKATKEDASKATKEDASKATEEDVSKAAKETDRQSSTETDISPPSSAPETFDHESDIAISIADLTVSIGDLSILSDVSLSMESGEFVGLVGPNGVGKTTLLRTISGALKPSSGQVVVNGVDIRGASSRQTSRLVATVPQDTAISFSFPVRDVVAMGRYPHRSRFSSPTPEDRDRVSDALERTRTTALAQRPIDSISGGERQRVVLARALAQQTPVLLLDEPTANLDVNHQIETMELVRSLTDDGRTIVAAIHDLDVAARYCDRLVVMADGTVFRDGKPEEVLTVTSIDRAFDAHSIVTANPITWTPTVTTVADEGFDGSGIRVHVFGTGTEAATLVARLTSAGVSLSVGPVPETDVVAETARLVGAEVIECAPFVPVEESHRRQFAAGVDRADLTVCIDPPATVATDSQLDSILDDAAIVVDTDVSNRDRFEPSRFDDLADQINTDWPTTSTTDTERESTLDSGIGADTDDGRSIRGDRRGAADRLDDLSDSQISREKQSSTGDEIATGSKKSTSDTLDQTIQNRTIVSDLDAVMEILQSIARSNRA